MSRYIVGEVSKNWNTRSPGIIPPYELIQKLFERMIEVNVARGYTLHSFQLHRLMTSPDEMNETIIAVFERTHDR